MSNVAGTNGLVGTVTATFGVMRMGAPSTETLDPTSIDSVMQEWQKTTAIRLGDKVDFSDEGKAKAKAFAGPRDVNKGAKTEEAEAQEEDPMVKSTKDRIQQIQDEIKELEQSDLPEKEKQMQISMLTQEMATLTKMLEKLQGTASEMADRYGKGGLAFNMTSTIS